MATFTLVSSLPTSPTRATPISGGSPGRSRQNQNFGGMATFFRALSPTDKATWQSAANTLNIMQARVSRHKLSAVNAFTLCNSGRVAVSLPILSTAPGGAELSMPPMLPGILVNASSVAGRFSLTLTPTFGVVTNPVQILACAPQIAGKTTWPDNAFHPIGAVDSFSSGANNISDMFSNKYGVPSAGYEICLRLVATSESGLRRSPLLVTGFCASAAATDTHTDEDESASLRVA